jgi:hypothetical protein
VDEETTPKQLHEKALDLWKASGDLNPESELYAAADAEIATASDPKTITSNGHPQDWALTLLRYEEFWRSARFAPRENTRNRETLPVSEARLGYWARYQRRFRENLTRFQEIRLDVSPAFVWDPWGEVWEENYRTCADIVDRTGKLPWLSGTDQDLFDSARWLNRQLLLMKNSLLDRDRERRVVDLLLRAKSD